MYTRTSYVGKGSGSMDTSTRKNCRLKMQKNRARISEKLSINENEQRKFKLGQKFSRRPSPRENNFESNL